jgi:uncharacterized protein
MIFHRNMNESITAQLLGPHVPFLQVLIGLRQVGKSTFIGEMAKEWKGFKIIESADGIIPRTTDWIEFLWQSAIEKNAPVLLSIDEFQKVKGWPETIKLKSLNL